MQMRGHLFVGAMLLLLGGCILGYPLDQYDTAGSTSSSSSSGGSGGEVGAGGGVNAASTSGSGSGGAGGGAGGGGGGGGGGVTCTSQVVCNERPISGCDMDCPVHAISTRLSAAKNQTVRSVAINANGDVAIAGFYSTGVFPVNPANTNVLLPDAGGPDFNEGFIGYYNTNLGYVWAQNIGTPIPANNIGRGVSGIAFDSSGNLVVAGVETLAQPQPPETSPPSQFFIRKLGLATPTMPTEPWAPQKPFAQLVYASSSIALAVDGTDFYVLGETMDSGTTKLVCANTNAPLTSGMFVAKYNMNGACQWVRTFEQAITRIGDGTLFAAAISAENAAARGVWITGKTTRAISLAPSLTADLGASGGGNTYGFVIGLKSDNGDPAFGVKLNGNVTPRAISVLNATETSATVALAGNLNGVTSLNTDVTLPSSFVSVLEISAKNPVDMMSPSSFTPKTTLLSSSSGSTDATAMVVRGNRIHIAGTISEKIALPSPGSELTVTNWAPYLATLSTDTNSSNTPPVLGIQVFDSKSAPNESPKALYMATSMNKLAVAGSWANSVDVSTRHAPMAGALSPISSGDISYDVFFAKYSITP